MNIQTCLFSPMPWLNERLLFQYRFMRPINLCGYLTQIKTNGCSLRSSIHLHLIAGARGPMITNISLHTAAQSPNTFPFNDFSSFLVIFYRVFYWYETSFWCQRVFSFSQYLVFCFFGSVSVRSFIYLTFFSSTLRGKNPDFMLMR